MQEMLAAKGSAGLALAILLVLLTALVSYRNWAALHRTNAQMELTLQVLRAANNLLSTLKDAESGQRGFLLTGRDADLASYERAVAAIGPLLNELTALAARQADQAERAKQIKPLIEKELAELRQLVEIRRSQGPAAALASVTSEEGKIAMDEIRRLLGSVEDAADRRFKRQSSEVASRGNRLGLAGIIGACALFAMLALSAAAVRRGEDAPRSAVKELRLVADATAVCLARCDREFRYLFVNRAYAERFGLKPEQVIGKTIPQILGQAAFDSFRTKVDRVLNGEALEFEEEIPYEGLGSRFMHVSYAPEFEQGRVTGLVAAITDITARRRIESALREANEDLKHFAFAASHDLQEPLRTLTIYSDLLTKNFGPRLEGQGAVCVKAISQGAKRMKTLLDDLLAYSQIGVAEEEDRAEIVDLNAALQKALANCKAAVEESGASVSSVPLPALPGHEAHYVQLFQNLIGNAVKYRGAESPRIGISVEKAGANWKFSVADNGMGISPEYHEQIFGVFKRLHGKNIEGTGIGLAICKRVIDRYGGRIWVQSQLNQGATFHFTLPEKRAGG